MRRPSAEALLLDVRDLQEKDRIVTFLTAEYGQKRGVARSARTKFSRYAGQLQPLAKVQVSWFEKEGRDLVRIGDVELIRPAMAAMEDLEGILLSSYLAEHMVHFAQEDEPSPKLYRLLDTSVDALLAGIDRQLVARYYEVWVLRLAGIFPPPMDCPMCGRTIDDRAALLAAEAAVVCPDCGQGGTAVGPTELEFLRRSAFQNLPTMAQDPPPPSTLRRIEQLCGRIRRHFLQTELRSYRVMQDTLLPPP